MCTSNYSLMSQHRGSQPQFHALTPTWLVQLIFQPYPIFSHTSFSVR